MNITDIVYLVTPVTIYGHTVPKSGQILKGTIVEILPDLVTIEIELTKDKSIYREVNKKEYHKTFAEALNALESLINNKVVFIDEKDYTGDEPREQ